MSSGILIFFIIVAILTGIAWFVLRDKKEAEMAGIIKLNQEAPYKIEVPEVNCPCAQNIDEPSVEEIPKKKKAGA